MFLKISQNSQENICAGVSFLYKVAGPRLRSCKFWEICKNTFFYRAPPVAASKRYLWNSFKSFLKRSTAPSTAHSRLERHHLKLNYSTAQYKATIFTCLLFSWTSSFSSQQRLDYFGNTFESLVAFSYLYWLWGYLFAWYFFHIWLRF